jgi:hypothetical protein
MVKTTSQVVFQSSLRARRTLLDQFEVHLGAVLIRPSRIGPSTAGAPGRAFPVAATGREYRRRDADITNGSVSFISKFIESQLTSLPEMGCDFKSTRRFDFGDFVLISVGCVNHGLYFLGGMSSMVVSSSCSMKMFDIWLLTLPSCRCFYFA